MTELPSGWVWSTIGDVCVKPKYGWTTSASDSGKVKLLRTTDLTHGPINWETVPFCKEPPKTLADFEVHPNDIFISRAGSVGVSVLVKETPYKSVFASYLIRVRPTERIDSKYLSLFLQSPHYWNQVVELSSGIALANINATKIQSMTVPLPPIDEQHKIVELLEDHLSRLDAALAEVKQAKIKAAQFRRSLLQAAFIGYFSDESFKLGTEIPPSWRKISIGKVLEPRKQRGIPSAFPGLPYIGMEHVVRDLGLIDAFGSSSDYRSSAPRVYEGDVLYGRLRPYLNKVVISPCEAFASGEFIVLPANEEIMGKFLKLRLLSQDFVEFAGTLDTGDRPRVSWEQISQFELALPPIGEQIKMISTLDDHLSRLDASMYLADAIEKESFGLRRSLLQAAFTGQLTKEVVSV